MTNFLKLRESLGVDKEMHFHILGGMHGFSFSEKQAIKLVPFRRTCKGLIYQTRINGRHKCRPYNDKKRKFLLY